MDEKQKEQINRNFERLALRIADLNAEVSKIRIIIQRIDRDLNQWMMQKKA